MVRQLEELHERCQAGRPEVAGEAAAFAGEWLRRHIMGTDRLLARFLTHRGVR